MIDLEEIAGGGIKTVRTDLITATGTYNKPGDVLPDDIAVIDIWGAGQGGGYYNAPGNDAQGGVPGSWLGVVMSVEEMPASTSVSIGAGGLAAVNNGSRGVAGGDTKFLNWTAPGGVHNQGNLIEYIKGLFDLSPFSVQNQVMSFPAPFWPQLKEWEFPYSFAGYLLQTTLGAGDVRPNSNATNIAFNRGGWGGGTAYQNSAPAGYAVFDAQPSRRGGSGGQGGTSGTGARPSTAGGVRGGGGGGGAGVAASPGGRGEVQIKYFRGPNRFLL